MLNYTVLTIYLSLMLRITFGTLDCSVLFSLRATMKRALNFLETVWELRTSDPGVLPASLFATPLRAWL